MTLCVHQGHCERSEAIHVFSVYKALVCILFSAFQAYPPSSAHAEDGDYSHDEVDTNKRNLSQIVQSILDNQGKILLDIEAERKRFNESLRDEIVHLATLRQSIYNDFNKLYQLYWLNKNQPLELSHVVEQMGRFIFQLHELYDPMLHTHAQIKLRLQQLNNLIDTLKALEDDAAHSMLEKALSLQEFYTLFDTRITRVLNLTQSVLDDLSSTHKDLEKNMPSFWYSYYVNQKVDFFTNMLTWKEDGYISHVVHLIELSALRELPTTAHAWWKLLQNIALLAFPFLILGILAHRYIGRLLPTTAHLACKDIIATSLPWIVLGIILQYTSWYGGNRYQLINALGTFALCFGQVRLACQILYIKREDTYPKKSPFILVHTVLVTSFVLLTLTDVTVFFILPWLVFLFYILWRIAKTARLIYPISRLLMRTFAVAICVGILVLLLTGRAHLSFFLILSYMCLMMGVHQAQACIYATNLISVKVMWWMWELCEE